MSLSKTCTTPADLPPCDCQLEAFKDQALEAATPIEPNVQPIENLSSLPVINSLSLKIIDNIATVNGSCSARQGTVYAHAAGDWKAIGEIDLDGNFCNINVPASHLKTKDSILVQVRTSTHSSIPVLANNHFTQPRSFMIPPTRTMHNDRIFYRWWLLFADYQPTGYRLPKNVSATIVLDGDDDSEVYATIGVQGLARPDDRTQQTDNMRQYRLRKGENTLRDPIGGVLHIRNNGTAACRVIVDEPFEPFPYYMHGETQAADFEKMLQSSGPLSEVQLVGDRVSICSYHDTFVYWKAVDIASIVTSHETAVSFCAATAGLDGSAPKHTRSNMWLHAVESRSTASPFATTGIIALPHGPESYMRALLAGEAHKQWVTLHEYGHHFQSDVNSIVPFNEVSVNLGGLAAGLVYRHDYFIEFPQRWAGLKKWLDESPTNKNFLQSPDNHAIFEQLRRAFSSDFIASWSRYIRDIPVAPSLPGFTTSLCTVANFDLRDFFIKWGVIKENDQAWKAIEALNLPPAQLDLTALRPYV